MTGNRKQSNMHAKRNDIVVSDKRMLKAIRLLLNFIKDTEPVAS